MSYDLIIKNGNVVFRDGVRKVDIGVKMKNLLHS